MSHISASERDGITVITADRPLANAMNVEFLRELVAALDTVAGAPPAALVLAGRPGFFSAGVDLKAIPAYGAAEQREMIASINRMALTTYGLPCPVVAAITGHAIAGGFVLAVCTDYRVASLEGRYGLTEVKVGVPYPVAAIGVVRAELTPQAARVLALGNHLTDAERCVALGAFDEAVPADAVLDRALEVARDLAALPTAVYARTKLELRAAALAAIGAAVESDPLLEAWAPGE